MRARVLVFSTLLVVLVSVVLTALDYYFVRVDGLPYREGRLPTIGSFYEYQLVLIFPVIALASFEVAIGDYLREASGAELKQEVALGVANLLLGVLLEDSLWFGFRAIAPVKTDPFAGSWIQPADPTAAILGYANIAGAIVPVWYFILIPPIVAIVLGLLILSPSESFGG